MSKHSNITNITIPKKKNLLRPSKTLTAVFLRCRMKNIKSQGRSGCKTNLKKKGAVNLVRVRISLISKSCLEFSKSHSQTLGCAHRTRANFLFMARSTTLDTYSSSLETQKSIFNIPNIIKLSLFKEHHSTAFSFTLVSLYVDGISAFVQNLISLQRAVVFVFSMRSQ